MRQTAFFTIAILVLCSQSFARVQAENLIVLPAAELSLEDVIHEIQVQTTLTFTYSNKINTAAKIIFSSTRLTVQQILDTIHDVTGVTWQVKGSKIILKPAALKHTIEGYMRDLHSGENLIGGNIYSVPDLHGTTTNTFGHFSFTLPEGSISIMASYVGYDASEIRFELNGDTTLNLLMKNTELNEVLVLADTSREAITELTQMSSITVPIQQLKSLPAMAGEVDVMKSLSLLPGVQPGPEGSTGLYVRGGGPDQNLVLLDGVPVYNASHLYGFFSVFNADAINHVELIKGGFPARYAGRLSSVVDISMKEGNKEKLKGEGAVGIVGAKFTLEGPLKKDKATFIISGRRTYADLLTKPFTRNKPDQYGYSFYDLNAKVNYKINAAQRLFMSFYSGDDQTYSATKYTTDNQDKHFLGKDKSDIGWGNLTGALRWNYVISPKLFSNVTATYTRYRFRVDNNHYARTSDEADNVTERFVSSVYKSSIMDYALKADFDYLPSAAHYIKFGLYGIHHTFRPGANSTQSSNEPEIILNNKLVNSIEFGAYVEDDIVITKKLKSNLGFHVSGTNVDQMTFVYPQPRVALRYLLNPALSFKASYATMAQYVHLLTNAGIGLPTDLWLPATSKVKPMRSNQVAAGAAWSPNKTYDLTVEVYYKKMKGVIEYKDGASYVSSADWQDKVEIGQGESYGSELLLQKKAGKWTGWFGYTLSWTNRQFDNINFGKKFPYRYDRRHDIEIVANRALNKKVDFAGTWVYGTGNAVTLPVAVYGGDFSYTNVFGQAFYYNLLYEGRNGYRLRAYHRLDLSISFKKATRWGERKWVFSIYNAYGRRNPYYIGFLSNSDGYRRLYQFSLFRVIPSITYNFKF